MKKHLSLIFSLVLLPTLFSCGQEGHTHTYSEPTWVWNEYTSATATFNCGCGEQVVLVDNEITSYQDPAKSCFIDGIWNYVASVTLDGKIYTDKKTISDPAPNKHGDLICIPFDDEMHQYKCSVCGDIVGQKKTHDYGEYVIRKNPTYTEEGIKERTCSTCGHTQVTKISKLKLSYSEIKTILDKVNAQDENNMYADSYFIDGLNSYSYADIDNFTKEQADEINSLKASIETKYNTWKSFFGLLYEGKNMGYTNVSMTTALDYDSSKGSVTTIKSTLSIGESWTYSVAMPKDVDAYEYISFSIWFDQPSDILVINTNWTMYLDLLNDTVYKNPKDPVLNKISTAKQWVTFNISKANWKAFGGDLSINLYLTYNEIYGIRTTGKPAYITNIYGIKDEFFKGQVEIIKNAIDDLPSSSSLTVFSGSKIQNVRNRYNKLPDSLKGEVSNYQKLVDLEAAYNKKWGISFEMRETFNNYTNFGGVFEKRETLSNDLYGDYVHYKANNVNYALSFDLTGKVTEDFKTITFAVMSTTNYKFTLTTTLWWTDGYASSTASLYKGDALTQCNFFLKANTWTVLSLPVSAFNEVNMVQLIGDGSSISLDLSITSFYGVK